MTNTLNISADLQLPRDVVTQTVGILAKKRRGKTYTASVIAEEMIKAKLPFAVLDPTSAWWGLRAAANGIDPGYPVVIIGGAHGDIPLEPSAGAIIADLVVDHPGYYIIDMGDMDSNAAQDRFAMEFGERLYRAKAKQRFPMHLFVDEADAFIPQQPMPDQRRMLGAYDTIVRRGGVRGIGVTLISQRPAVVNKNVLSQVECLIVLQIIGTSDREAIEKWVKVHGAKKHVAQLMDSLASLGLGEAWFWSPVWLEVFKKVQIRQRETFNSSKTPEVGDELVQPKALAPVDIKAIREKIAATIEQKKNRTGMEMAMATQPTIKEALAKEYQRGYDDGNREGYQRGMQRARELLAYAQNQLDLPESHQTVPRAKPGQVEEREANSDRKNGSLHPAAVKMLDALERNHHRAYTWEQVAALAGILPGNGHFYGGKKSLAASGLVEERNGTVRALSQRDGRITPLDVVNTWSAKLKAPAPAMLRAIYDRQQITVNDLAKTINAKPGNGHWYGGVAALREAGLITQHDNILRATELILQ